MNKRPLRGMILDTIFAWTILLTICFADWFGIFTWEGTPGMLSRLIVPIVIVGGIISTAMGWAIWHQMPDNEE